MVSNSLQDKKYEVVASQSSKLGRFEIVLDTIAEGTKRYPFSYIKQKPSVCVLPLVEDNVLFIRQYRHSLSEYMLEIPGGGIRDGEDPRDIAIKELKEETGYSCYSLDYLGKYYPSPGSSNEITYLYAANCYKMGNPNKEPLEYIETQLIPKTEVEYKIICGDIKHGMTLVAWLYYKMKEKNVN